MKPYTEKSILGLLIGLFLTTMIVVNGIYFNTHQQFVYQADAFLHAQFELRVLPESMLDIALFDNQAYWPLGPFPAVLLMPFVTFFGLAFSQAYLQIGLNIGVFVLAYLLARKWTFSAIESVWLSIAFTCSSVYLYIGMIPESWYYAQVVTVILLLGALLEFFTHRRWWFIGILLAFVTATRLGAGIQILFFVLANFFTQPEGQLKETVSQKIINTLQLFAPMLLTAGLLMHMNYARFGSTSQNGYWYQQLVVPNNLKRELYGLFNTQNVGTNIFRYFFWVPYIFPWKNNGLEYTSTLHSASFFVISPIFLWIFKADWKNKIVWMLVAGFSVTLIMLMMYYASGSRLGPRYMNDILPLLYIILLYAFTKTGIKTYHKIIITVSALCNLVLLALL